MKYLPWVLLVLAIVVAVVSQPPKPDGSKLAIAQAHIAQLMADSAIYAAQSREREDSLNDRLAQAIRGQDESRRRVPVDSTKAVLADSLSRAATTMAELRAAYDTLRVAFDSSQRTVSIAQQSTNDALAALAFSRLQRLADSTRIAGFEQSAPIVLQASKKSWWQQRVVIGPGYGIAKVGQQVVLVPTMTVTLRLWPL